ncbi:hypothetical protein [Nocardia sp. NPDC049149]|uniref:LtfC-like domain-containing protein n=1 Tax=Nocardia sp. NPDC049149 TaxID=3364315 RepID=UPI003722A8EE
MSKGGDLLVDFRNKVPGSSPATYTDYPSGVAVLLIIDTDVPISATATIATNHAVVRVESEVADAIPQGKLWRCIYRVPGTPTTEVVLANGKTERHDGKS